jgi:hypothetical protein
MDIRAFIIKMVGMQKASFDNGFAALETIQYESERITNDFMDKAGWVPSVSKGMMREWFGLVKKGRDDFKKAIDSGYAQVGGYIDTAFQKGFTL